MFAKGLDLAFNVSYALQICPPDYVHSILGDPESWSTKTCPRTELQLAELKELGKGLPALAHILIPALARKPPVSGVPLSDLFFRPSVVFSYPRKAGVDPTPRERWFFINGICTDHSVVLLNADYLYFLFRRPLTVVHNFTRGIVADLAACAVGKEWDQITESAAVALPPIYAALKDKKCKRVVLLAHSQGTILSAVVLATLQRLHSPARQWLDAQPEAGPERRVAQKLDERWNFESTMGSETTARKGKPAITPSFYWPGRGWRQPEQLTRTELCKLEMYCFANCATEMRSVPVKTRGPDVFGPAWIESYGNEMDIVARLGVLAKTEGPGSARIEGDRYVCKAAWGHLLNAHYLHPMIGTRRRKESEGKLVPLEFNRRSTPRLFEYLGANSPSAVQ